MSQSLVHLIEGQCAGLVSVHGFYSLCLVVIAYGYRSRHLIAQGFESRLRAELFLPLFVVQIPTLLAGLEILPPRHPQTRVLKLAG